MPLLRTCFRYDVSSKSISQVKVQKAIFRSSNKKFRIMNRNATAAHFRFRSILLAGVAILVGILLIIFATNWAYKEYLHYSELYERVSAEVTKAKMELISIIEAM
jgi:hypothetical protein